MQTHLVNQLTACLKASFPVALKLFSKLQQKATLAFLLTYPTPQAAQTTTIAQFTATLKQAGHPTPEPLAVNSFEALRQPQLGAYEVTIKTKSRLMLALLAQQVPLLEQTAAHDKVFAELFLTQDDSQLFASRPGASKRLAPRLLAEWRDDRKRYGDPSGIQALAGTSPAPFESGN